MKRLSGIFASFMTLLGISVVRLLSYLPLRMLYILSDIICVLLYYVVRYRRRMVYANMSAAFPEMDKKTLGKNIRGFYRNFSDYMVETVKLLHVKTDTITGRMVFDGLDIIEDHLRHGRSVVAYFAHTFNWEWAPSITRDFPADFSEVVFGQIYRPLRNERWDALMLRIRSRFGSVSIPKKMTLRHLLQSRKDGQLTLTGFMSDQKPSHGDPEHVITFLGQPTCVITGTETLARRLGMAAVYWDMAKEGRGRYRITVRPIVDDVSATVPGKVTDAYFKLLEQTIRRQPQIWLWSHNRWQRNRRHPETNIRND